jgi:hypothetical protein
MRLGLATVVIAIAALLAGCTSAVEGAAANGNASSSVPGPTSTAAPTPPTEPPTAPPTVLTAPNGSPTETFGYWTTSVAQRQYLVLADQHNSELAALNQALCGCAGSVEVLQVTDACYDLASNDEVAAEAFAEDPWPSDAVAAAQSLATAIKVEATGFADCADATTIDAARSALEQITPATAQVAAMRAALGLPALPTQSDPSTVTA